MLHLLAALQANPIDYREPHFWNAHDLCPEFPHDYTVSAIFTPERRSTGKVSNYFFVHVAYSLFVFGGK